tara:strand:+ start:54 stop:272 length:219 start_codon:yes stop_codon:yes gene_type:complete
MNNDDVTYVGETYSLQCMDGELHIQYGDNKVLVMDADQLYRDLPAIIHLVSKEQKKMQGMYLEQIKNSIESL